MTNAPETKTFKWDYEQQPPLDEIAEAIQALSGGSVSMVMPDTGSDEYELHLSRQPSMWEQAYMDVQAVLDKAIGTGEDDSAGGGIAADVYLLAGQRDQAREQLAIAVAALRDLRDGHGTGTFAHDIAHAALDEVGEVTIPETGEADGLREQLTVARERLESLAAGMEMSAAVTSPSKKSQIERECAEAIRDVARSIAGSVAGQIARERDEARADRDDYAARLRATDKSWTELAAERDKLAEAGAALERLVERKARALYAARIEVVHGTADDASTILTEALDGYDGPQWDGTESGIEWLERTQPIGGES